MSLDGPCRPQRIHRVSMFDVPFDLLDMHSVLPLLIEQRDGFRYVVTPNTDHVVRLHRRPELRPIYENAWLSLCDSRILQRLGSVKGFPITHVTPGSTLCEHLFTSGILGSREIAVIGMTRDDVTLLESRFPAHRFRHYDPPMGFIRDPREVQRCCDFALENPVDLLFLCVGSPQQEILADTLSNTPGISGVALCVGSALRFLVGTEKRAPRWMQKVGLEWAYRLSRDPLRLWRRYLVDDVKIFWLTLRARRYTRALMTERLV